MTKAGLDEMLARMQTYFPKRYPKSMTKEHEISQIELWDRMLSDYDDQDVLEAIILLALEKDGESPSLSEIKQMAFRQAGKRRGEAETSSEDFDPVYVVNYYEKYDGVIVPGLPDNYYSGFVTKEKADDAKREHQRRRMHKN